MNFIFLISYIMSSNKTSLFGSRAGSYFDQKCPAGEYISQFYGYSMNNHPHPSVKPVIGIGARCSDGTDLGVQAQSGGNGWTVPFNKPKKNFSGAQTTLAQALGGSTMATTFMENGSFPTLEWVSNTSPWNDNCPSGAATGVYGHTDKGYVAGYGLQCGPPSNWCIDNLEDPMCAGVDIQTLNKSCAKTFSETCTNRKAELTDSTMNLYCASNPTADICSCYSQVPSYIPQEMAGLAPCWNKACATTGYIPQNMRGACPSITVCRQEMGTSGDSNMLTNNVILQDCGGKTNLANPDPQRDPEPPSDRAIQEANIAAERARTIAEESEDQQDILDTRMLILLIIIAGILLGVCVYNVIQYFINKKQDKTSNETQNETPDD